MEKSIFATLCDLVDAFERITYRLESSAVKDQMENLLLRFDAVIDRTIGLEQASVSPEDEPPTRVPVARTKGA